MKRYLFLILVLSGFSLSYIVFADEVAQKTDGSFVGDNPPAPINSSFVGDTSNSTVNESGDEQNLQEKTDGEFVGGNTTQAQDTLFAGESYHQDVGNGMVNAFSGDGTFVGKDYGK